MSSKAKESVAVSAILLFACAFFFVQSTKMPAKAALFPRMCLVLLTFLSVLLLCVDLKRYAKSDVKSDLHIRDLIRPLIGYAGVVLYTILFRLIGYFPATIILLIGFMLILKVKPRWLIAAITVGYCIFIYLMFVVWLKVSIL